MSHWIESHQTLWHHPRKDALAEALYGGMYPDDVADNATIGLLHKVWWWALDYAQDGDFSRFSSRQIARACEWGGDPDVLVHALVDSGFLGEDHTIHDWYDYAGKLIERREKNRERMRDARSEPVQRTCNARAEHVHGDRARTCEATQPNPTIQNQEQEHICADEPVDNSVRGGFLTQFWPNWPHRKGSKQIAGKRFTALSPTQQKRCIAAEGHVIAALDAGLLDPQYLPRAENFIGGTKCYYREWADGIPEHLSVSGNGKRSGRAVDSAFGALGAVARQLDSEVDP